MVGPQGMAVVDIICTIWFLLAARVLLSQSALLIRTSMARWPSSFRQKTCSLLRHHSPCRPPGGCPHHNVHPGWCLWAHELTNFIFRAHPSGMLASPFSCKDILHLFLLGLCPLGSSLNPQNSPFGMKLSRWSQSRALQGMAGLKHIGANILSGECSLRQWAVG